MTPKLLTTYSIHFIQNHVGIQQKMLVLSFIKSVAPWKQKYDYYEAVSIKELIIEYKKAIINKHYER